MRTTLSTICGTTALWAVGPAVIMFSGIALAQSTVQTGYHKGELLARALEHTAAVFTGVVSEVRAVTPPAGADPSQISRERTIRLNSVDWLLAPPNTPRPPELTVRAFDPPTRSKTLDGPWAVWQGIDLKPGTKLLLVRTPGAQPPSGDSDQPWVVASQPAQLTEIAGIVRTFTALESDFSQAAGLMEQVRQPNDGIIAGFGITYLLDCGARRNLAQTAGLLTSAIGSAGATEKGWRESLAWLTSSWSRLPEANRNQARDSIVAAAAAPNASLYRPAFEALMDIYSLDPGALAAVSPASKTGLQQNYRSLRNSGAIPQRNAGFEKALGLEGQ